MGRPSRTFARTPQPAEHSRQVERIQSDSPGNNFGAVSWETSLLGTFWSQAVARAAPVLAPRIRKKSLRFIANILRLLVARPTIRRRVVFPVTAHAPAHFERPDLVDLEHCFHFAVAHGTIHVGGDVAFMSKADVPWQLMNLRPLDGFLVVPVFCQDLDFRAVKLGFRVAFHAHGERGRAGGRRVCDGDMALGAGEPHLVDMRGVGELDRLDVPLGMDIVVEAQPDHQQACQRVVAGHGQQ